MKPVNLLGAFDHPTPKENVVANMNEEDGDEDEEESKDEVDDAEPTVQP